MRAVLHFTHDELETILRDHIVEKHQVDGAYSQLREPSPANPYANRYIIRQVPLTFITTIDGKEYELDNVRLVYDSSAKNKS